jgi:parallel beta-helix repeat protein
MLQKVQAEMISGNTVMVAGLSLSANANIAGATIQSLAYNTAIPSTNYATLQAAISAAGPNGNTILVCSNLACTANTTVPANVALTFIGGGRITIDTNVQLTVNSTIQAAGTQIFTGNGIVQFASAGKLGYVRPQWWGAVADGVTDDTTAFKHAVNTAVTVYVSPGTYIIQSVPIYSSIRMYGDGDTSILKRQANTDDEVTFASMFEVMGANTTTIFDHLLFDGNEANQDAVTPVHSILAVRALTGPNTKSLSMMVDNCTFLNQTHTSIYFRGVDHTNQRQLLHVQNCRFFDGRKGIGIGDPLSNSAVGFTPVYINVFDAGRIICTGNQFVFRRALANTGEYAPSAVRWTYYVDQELEDGSSGQVTGNYIYRCGRGRRGYDGDENGNNGLGALEFYARARLLTIHGNTLEHCFQGIRGKVNCDEVSIAGNILANTDGGIAIYPSTSGIVNRGYISILGNSIANVDSVGIAVVGNSTVGANLAFGVTIVGNVINTVDNKHGDATNFGGIAARYVADVVIADNVLRNIRGGDTNGITVLNCNRAIVEGNQTSANNIGIYLAACYNAVLVASNSVRGTTRNAGIYVSAIGEPTDQSNTIHTIASNVVDTSNNYGIIVYTGSYITCIGNQVANVSGLSRGYYFAGNANGSIISNVTGASVTTPFTATEDGCHSQNGNSWNPYVTYRSSAPITGTWRVGDIAWNSSPAASGTMGWICVTAGTPGTWKSFATIAA